MSVELRIYSSRPPVTHARLARFFRDGALPDSMRWFLRFTDTRGALARPGTLDSGGVLAWPAARGRQPGLDAALRAGAQPALDALYAADRVALVELTVLTPRRRGWRDAVSLDEVPPEHRAAIAAARAYYHLETHAGRNPLSEAFPEILWKMLGVLEYALMEDPQEGTYEDVGAALRAEAARDRSEATRRAAATRRARSQRRS